MLTVFVTLSLTSFTVSFSTQVYSQRAPRVLIDVAHEFTFAFDAFLPVGYLEPNGYQFTKLLATLNSSIIANYDVLVIEQATTNVSFSTDQIVAIKDFVNNGGGLLLVGKGWVWQGMYPSSSMDSYPLNALAKEFGFKFTINYAVKPFAIISHEITTGVNTFENLDAVAGTLNILSDGDSIIKDSSGQTIVASRNFGQGRIIVTAEDVFISSPFTGKLLINQLFVKNLFGWLKINMIAQNTNQPIPYRILPENLVQLGPTKFYYPSALGNRATFLQEKFQQIYIELKNLMEVEITFNLTIIALSTGGGGYSGGAEIGIGVLTEESAVVRIMAHEMTHSWVLPGAFPGSLNEGWASLAAIRVARKMGYQQQADEERSYWERVFRESDPDGTKLDISCMPPGPPENQPYMGKAMWVIETLEGTYGSDLMQRFMRIKRSINDPTVTMGKFIYYMSKAVYEDLSTFFRNINTTFEKIHASLEIRVFRNHAPYIAEKIGVYDVNRHLVEQKSNLQNSQLILAKDTYFINSSIIFNQKRYNSSLIRVNLSNDTIVVINFLFCNILKIKVLDILNRTISDAHVIIVRDRETITGTTNSTGQITLKDLYFDSWALKIEHYGVPVFSRILNIDEFTIETSITCNVGDVSVKVYDQYGNPLRKVTISLINVEWNLNFTKSLTNQVEQTFVQIPLMKYNLFIKNDFGVKSYVLDSSQMREIDIKTEIVEVIPQWIYYAIVLMGILCVILSLLLIISRHSHTSLSLSKRVSLDCHLFM